MYFIISYKLEVELASLTNKILLDEEGFWLAIEINEFHSTKLSWRLPIISYPFKSGKCN